MAAEEQTSGGARDEAALLRLAIESMAQGMYMLDAEQRIIVLNQSFLAIYRLPPDIIKVGSTVTDIVTQSVLAGNYPGLTTEEACALAQSRFLSTHAWRVEQRLGNGRTIAIAFAPMPDGGWVTTHLDVTEKREAEDRLAFLANHDVLTGLANRHKVVQALTPEIESGLPLAILCIDLDGFKAVNDQLGHTAGDALLCKVAERLTAVCPPTALVARMGGDEFLVQFAGEHPGRVAPRVAAAVLRAMGAPFRLQGGLIRIGASIGIAVAPADGTTLEMLIGHADLAMYVAKHSGRNSFRFYTAAMSKDAGASVSANEGTRRRGSVPDRRGPARSRAEPLDPAAATAPDPGRLPQPV